MTQPLRRFPDVQALLVEDLQSLAGPNTPELDHTGIETPADLAGALPFIRARRRGGPSTRLFDTATIDIDAFHSTYAGAELLAEQVRQRLVGPPPPVWQFDEVECVNGPQQVPWGANTGVHRFTAAYLVRTRRVLVQI